LHPLRHVCILHRSLEDLDHAWLRICQDELFTAGRAAALALMTVEHQHIGAIAYRDIRAVAEALADVLAERGLVIPASPASPARVLDAAQVADLLGRDRQWVYAHAGELGAFRYGDGPKARIGFDLVTVEQWKRDRQIRSQSPPPRRHRRRSSAVGVGATRLIPYDVPSSGT
jgi:hypothetical protein